MDARSGPGVRHGEGTKPPLRILDPLHAVGCTLSPHVNHGGGLTLATPHTGRPGEKRAASMPVCRPLAHDPCVLPRLLETGECPHYPQPAVDGSFF